MTHARAAPTQMLQCLQHGGWFVHLVLRLVKSAGNIHSEQQAQRWKCRLLISHDRQITVGFFGCFIESAETKSEGKLPVFISSRSVRASILIHLL